ncbi:MAG: iron-containing alcohol dehydrogenase [Pseudomonadota bacterium]
MRSRAAEAQIVIGIRGGAAMDAAKLVAATARADLPTSADVLGGRAFPSNGLPAIARPTTAGSGSEVTHRSIVSTSAGTKNQSWRELMFAHAIFDPELTVSLPLHLTAWTGIDAVAHAHEASSVLTTNSAGLLRGLLALTILAEAFGLRPVSGSICDVG